MHGGQWQQVWVLPPPAIHVEGPEFVGNGVARGAGEGRKIGVPAHTLELQERVDMGMAEVVTVPGGAGGVAKDQTRGIHMAAEAAQGGVPGAKLVATGGMVGKNDIAIDLLQVLGSLFVCDGGSIFKLAVST